MDSNANNEFNPKLNVRILAATILYISFAHLDHWPVPLVKAYAEDCFGPRLWVDDENCKILVENLKLVHKNKPKDRRDEADEKGDAEMADATMLENAARVADSYNKILDLLAEDDAQANTSPVQQVRRGSMSSVSSGGPISHTLKRSNSRDEADSVVGNGTRVKKVAKRKLSRGKKKGSSDDGASSSSGEEDEEVIVTTKSGGDEAASSPRKQAESPTESHRSSETAKGGNVSPSPLKQRLYPLTQARLKLVKVRQRYFGLNREAAHDAITSSLSERLDAKAKQNSALLQCLHSLTSVSGVRSLIAGNLEKWLQSPGLSGLARTLFTSTVKSIENVDPPRPADLDAIRKILSMRLKANQVRPKSHDIYCVKNCVLLTLVATAFCSHRKCHSNCIYYPKFNCCSKSLSSTLV